MSVSDLLVPPGANLQDPDVRARVGLKASVTCIICNVCLCAAKAVVGMAAGSLSIVADALNNLTDAASNIVSLLGFKLAAKPPDPEHPWGHGRFEYLAGMVVAALVCAVGLELVRESGEKIVAPEAVDFGMAQAAVLVMSMAVKAAMMRLNRTLGIKIHSETLEATAQDSRNDVITTGVVLAASLINVLWGTDLDGWAGLAVGVFIVVSGIGLVKDTVNPLLGAAPSAQEVEHIKTTIMGYPGVLGTHDLMVHDYGPGRQFASAHVEMAAEADPLVSHDVIDQIEQDFKERDGLVMTLHYDPVVTKDPRFEDFRHWLAEEVKTIHPQLTVHDVRVVAGQDHKKVVLDCVKPFALEMSDAELRERICALVRERHPEARCTVTVDHGYLSTNQ